MAPEFRYWRHVVENAPAEWARLPLKDVFRERKETEREDLPLLAVTSDRGIIPRDELERRDTSSSDKSKYQRVAPGDLAYNTMRMWQGVSAVSAHEGIVSPAYTVCEIRDPHDAEFMGYLCKLPLLIDRFHAYSQGIVSDTLSLRFRQFGEILTPIPPASEQREVAAILSSVDDAIAATRKVIEQTKRVKQGLLQTLMTRGIGHTQFKPVPSDWVTGRPHSLLEIPESWQVVPLTEVARLESGHTPSRSSDDYWGGEIPWVSLHDTERLTQRMIYETSMTVTQAGLDNSSARLLPEGTVVLSRTATVGLCSLLGRAMATSQDFANYVCGPRVHNAFLCHLFRWMAPVWKSLCAGSTHKTVYMPDFTKLRIALPSISEQKEIVSRIDACDDLIESAAPFLQRAQRLKRGLMQDLLTGRVRVQPD